MKQDNSRYAFLKNEMMKIKWIRGERFLNKLRGDIKKCQLGVVVRVWCEN